MCWVESQLISRLPSFHQYNRPIQDRLIAAGTNDRSVLEAVQTAITYIRGNMEEILTALPGHQVQHYFLEASAELHVNITPPGKYDKWGPNLKLALVISLISLLVGCIPSIGTVVMGDVTSEGYVHGGTFTGPALQVLQICRDRLAAKTLVLPKATADPMSADTAKRGQSVEGIEMLAVTEVAAALPFLFGR